MFILIIFFLATATFKEEAITDQNVAVPNSDITPKPTTGALRNIIVNLRTDGSIMVQNPLPTTHRVEAKTEKNLDAMSADLKRSLDLKPDIKVDLRVDKDTKFFHVAKTLKPINAAGFVDANIIMNYVTDPTP